MSVRKRTWTTQPGEQREAWIVVYTHNGRRHIETFERKKDADARHAEVKVDMKAGVHVPPSRSATVAEAADLWLTGAAPRIEAATLLDYKAHTKRIVANLGQVRLSDLNSARIRAFEDRLRETCSEVMVRKALIVFGTMIADAQECGLVARNAVHELRRVRKGKRHGENRQKLKLKVGVDIPTVQEVAAILEAARTVGKGQWRPHSPACARQSFEDFVGKM